MTLLPGQISVLNYRLANENFRFRGSSEADEESRSANFLQVKIIKNGLYLMEFMKRWRRWSCEVSWKRRSVATQPFFLRNNQYIFDKSDTPSRVVAVWNGALDTYSCHRGRSAASWPRSDGTHTVSFDSKDSLKWWIFIVPAYHSFLSISFSVWAPRGDAKRFFGLFGLLGKRWHHMQDA